MIAHPGRGSRGPR